MISRQDAKYVIREIRNRKYYIEKLKEYDRKIEEIDMLMIDVTAPHSPVISNEPKGTGGKSHTARWASLIDRKDQILEDRREWMIKQQRAERYYMIIADGRDKDFVRDYYSGMTMEALQTKYNYSNAYDRMLRIVRSKIEHL